MKKFLAIFLSILMLVSLFACGKSDGDADTGKDTGGSDTSADTGSGGGSGAGSSDAGSDDAGAADSSGGVLRFVCTAEGASTIGLPWEVSVLTPLSSFPAASPFALRRQTEQLNLVLQKNGILMKKT